MKNVLICGSGRSGTSMLAGLFSECGYYQGEELYSPRDANPKGFFENWEINSLNERIIKSSLEAKFEKSVIATYESLRGEGHYWLARLPDNLPCVVSEEDKACIAALVDRKPFCYKDPRFSYTLPAWLQASPDTIALCVFRHPGIVVASILKELQSVEHLQEFSFRVIDLYRMWEDTYLRMLELRASGAAVYFVNYGDLFSECKQDELEEFVGAELNRSFPNVQLARTEFSGELSVRTASIFDLLNLFASRKFSSQSPDACKMLLEGLSLTVDKKCWPASVSALAEARLSLADEVQRAANLEELTKRLDTELVETRGHLADMNFRVVAFEQSASWRITQPLRMLKKWLIRLKR